MNKEFRDNIERLNIETHALYADMSINLDNQRVRIPKANGKGYRQVVRTVYRVRYEPSNDPKRMDAIIGNIHQKQGDHTWPQVRYHRESQVWRQDDLPGGSKSWTQPKSMSADALPESADLTPVALAAEDERIVGLRNQTVLDQQPTGKWRSRRRTVQFIREIDGKTVGRVHVRGTTGELEWEPVEYDESRQAWRRIKWERKNNETQ